MTITAAFAAAMDRLGPFEPQPRVAVAVSGGADSMAAAVLTRDWVTSRGGEMLALVVDHGLRAESSSESEVTCVRLRSLGIASELIRLSGLARGAGLAARARDARHASLERACSARGIVHLVFGHHAADQAETVAMRMLAHSAPSGLAAMAALVENRAVRRLRPLLGMAPGDLRAVLRERGVAWVEDPSNQDPTQLRARLRALRADSGGTGPATRALVSASIARGRQRSALDGTVAAELLCRVTLYPQGYALLSPGPISPEALARLLAVLSGAERPPALSQVAHLAQSPKSATLAGVRLLPAGRLGAGWLLVREASAMAPPVPAVAGAIWDGRFRLARIDTPGAGLTLGAWGSNAPRDRRGLPSAVRWTLPVVRCNGEVIAAGAGLLTGAEFHILPEPRYQLAAARFFPLPQVCG